MWSSVILDDQRSLEQHPAATTTLNSLVLLRLFVGLAQSFIFRGDRLRILFDSKHAARVTIGVAHAVRTIALARTCNELLLRLKCIFHILPIMFLATLALSETNAPILPLLWA